MEPSLSVILPVHNAQSTLISQVDELLDVLPDLSVNFEIVVVDDGSTDLTEEVATELARAYPQLKFIRRALPGGVDATVGDGLKLCAGDIVFVHELGGAVNVASLIRLWQLRKEDGLVTARADTPKRSLDFSVVRRLNTGLRKSSAPISHGGFQMIRRDTVEANSAKPAEPGRLRFASLGSDARS